MLRGNPLKDVDGRKDDGTDRARLDRVGKASFLVGPAPSIDVEEHGLCWRRKVKGYNVAGKAYLSLCKESNCYSGLTAGRKDR